MAMCCPDSIYWVTVHLSKLINLLQIQTSWQVLMLLELFWFLDKLLVIEGSTSICDSIYIRRLITQLSHWTLFVCYWITTFRVCCRVYLRNVANWVNTTLARPSRKQSPIPRGSGGFHRHLDTALNDFLLRILLKRFFDSVVNISTIVNHHCSIVFLVKIWDLCYLLLFTRENRSRAFPSDRSALIMVRIFYYELRWFLLYRSVSPRIPLRPTTIIIHHLVFRKVYTIHLVQQWLLLCVMLPRFLLCCQILSLNNFFNKFNVVFVHFRSSIHHYWGVRQVGTFQILLLVPKI
jgi:hypothetical protein